MADADQECIFCRVVRGEFGTEFLAENVHGVAFRDLNPQAPIHALVVPRRHIAALRDIGATDAPLIGELLVLASTVARQAGLHDGGFRIVVNDGADAGQTVFHLHLHVLGGRPLGALVGDR